MNRNEIPEATEEAGKSQVNVPVADLETLDSIAFKRARKRFPCECCFFILATFLMAFNLGAFYHLSQEIASYASKSLSLTITNQTALLSEYHSLMATYDPNNLGGIVCDVPYFVNTGFTTLQQNLNSLKLASLAIFYIAVASGISFRFILACRLGENK